MVFTNQTWSQLLTVTVAILKMLVGLGEHVEVMEIGKEQI